MFFGNILTTCLNSKSFIEFSIKKQNVIFLDKCTNSIIISIPLSGLTIEHIFLLGFLPKYCFVKISRFCSSQHKKLETKKLKSILNPSIGPRDFEIQNQSLFLFH